MRRVQRATKQLHFHLDRRKRVAAMVKDHSQPSARMRSEGYGSRSVCLSDCLSPTILALQATRRLTNSFGATRASKIMCRFC